MRHAKQLLKSLLQQCKLQTSLPMIICTPTIRPITIITHACTCSIDDFSGNVQPIHAYCQARIMPHLVGKNVLFMYGSTVLSASPQSRWYSYWASNISAVHSPLYKPTVHKSAAYLEVTEVTFTPIGACMYIFLPGMTQHDLCISNKHK